MIDNHNRPVRLMIGWAGPADPQDTRRQWYAAVKRLINAGQDLTCEDLTCQDFAVVEAMRRAGCTPESAAATVDHLHR